MIRRTILSILTALAILLLPLALLADGTRPFPQELSFAGCIKPSHVDQQSLNKSVTDRFNSYRNKYLRTSKYTTNGYYIEAKGNGVGGATSSTISEAHGYGMIIFALMAGYDPEAKEVFDGMYHFYKDHPSKGNSLNMSWVIDGNESGTPEYSATDGDMDIAYALLLAHDQWGSDGDINYKQAALQLIMLGIKAKDMGAETKRILLGDWASDQYDTRSSDWMTGHLHAFSQASGKSFFDEAADTIYSLISQITANKNTGLVSDFVTGSPAKPDPDAGGTGEYNPTHYSYNACRYPLRMAADFAHYGSTEARYAINTLTSWLRSECSDNILAIRAGYTLTGEPLNNYSDLVFNAPFAAGAIANGDNRQFLNDLWDEISTSDGSNEYAHALNLLSMLLISGNWWVPGKTVQESVEIGSVKDMKPKLTLVGSKLILTGIKGESAMVKVISLRGQLLYKKRLKIENSLLTDDISYTKFSSGFHLLQVEGDGYTITEKVIVSQ